MPDTPASVRLLIGKTPSPDMPIITPSSHRRSGDFLNASDGKLLAKVTPAFLFGYFAKIALMALMIGWMAVTAAVSLNNFGLSSLLASITQSIILAVNSAFCDTTSPHVPSPPCGHDRLYSTPIAPAFSNFFVFDCQTRLSSSSRPVTGPPVEASVSRSGNSFTSRSTSLLTRLSGCAETLSELPYVDC